jgi:diguanylate cyclase (GGDEF)-like protein/PAS domain S-box-containing protein
VRRAFLVGLAESRVELIQGGDLAQSTWRATLGAANDREARVIDKRPGVWDALDPDYESLVLDSGDVLFVTTINGLFRYVSPSSYLILGWEPESLVGKTHDDYVHPDDLEVVVATRLQLTGTDLATVSYRFRGSDGLYSWVETTARLNYASGEPLIVGSTREITGRRTNDKALRIAAMTDPLTGVANRNLLMDRLAQGLLRMKRTGVGMAVVYIDIDHFKLINDAHGHHVGDRVLCEMAKHIESLLRPSDTIARLGGDEFVVVAEDVTDANQALEVAMRIVESQNQVLVLEGEEYPCSVSVGVTWTDDGLRPADELLQEADLALYKAKGQGRHRAEIFGEELRNVAINNLSMERLVRTAIREHRVVVEYQPIIDLESNCVVSAEALVRIDQTDDGLLYPGSFLIVAAQTGLLEILDGIVLEDALARAGEWCGRYEGRGFESVSVNMTPHHLSLASFAKTFADHLAEFDLSRENLELEVTEQTLIEAGHSALVGLRALHALGVPIGIDDFGTGYSSLMYLRQLPITFVKIDQSFVTDIASDDPALTIVGAIIQLAHALGLRVVAEGVETAAQLALLREFGCDRAQGFLFSKSMRSESMDEFIRTGLADRLRSLTLSGPSGGPSNRTAA